MQIRNTTISFKWKRHPVSFSIYIYRCWAGSKTWTSRPTYRYAGINRLMMMKWYQLRVGWHRDHLGRFYLYLGKINVWQDIRPSRRRTLKFESRHIGPFELVTR